MTKICPKCLETRLPSSREKYCSGCGTKVIEVAFNCECGAELFPSFGYRTFPPWGRALNTYRKHCPHCGRDIRKLVKQQVRVLRGYLAQ